MSDASYLRRVILAAIGTIALVVATIVVIDPKGIYNLIRIEGFNAYKAYQNLYTNEVKALQARQYQPDTLIAGASPATFGIAPECRNAALPGISRIYNFGGPGASVYGLAAHYPDLRTIKSLRRVALETAFPNQRFIRPGQAPLALTPPGTGVWADRIRPFLPAAYATSYVGNLFSWHEVVLSLQTVAANLQSDRSFLFRGYAPNGAYDQTWLRRWHSWVLTEGSIHGHVKNYREVFIKNIANDMEADTSYVDALMERLVADGTTFEMFIRPEHVSQLLLYHEAGVWPLFEKFKRSLVLAAEQAAARFDVTIRVLDFNNLTEVALQAPRPLDDNTVFDPYFTDPVHYKRLVGDMVLATLYGCAIDHPIPPGFGVELTSANVDSHLASERAKLEAYRIQDPAMVRRVVDALNEK